MAHATAEGDSGVPFGKRLGRVVVSIVVLTGVTVVVGYGGWLLLTLAATLGVYDPVAEDGASLRTRLLEWSDRNREVMRTNGRVKLPLKP